MAVVAGIGLAIFAGGAVYQGVQQHKAAKARQNANNLQVQANKQNQLIAENNNRLSKIRSIRQARIAAANVQQFAVNAGSSTSSSAVTAGSAPFMDAASSIGFLNQQTGFARTRNALLSQATQFNNRAIGFQNRAATGQLASQVGGQVFTAAGGGAAFA